MTCEKYYHVVIVDNKQVKTVIALLYLTRKNCQGHQQVLQYLPCET